MKIWINKCNDEEPSEEYKGAYIFSLKRKDYSTVFTNLNDVWLMMGKKEIPTLNEDLFIIGLSIFAIDKRISRDKTFSRWTRDLEVSIPVIELEKWSTVKEDWESILSFLTGDKWKIIFRKTDELFSKRKRASRQKIDVSQCSCVSLFSGGLDSFCGAIDLLNHGEKPCLLGHNEYPQLRKKQDKICKMFREEYPEQKCTFISFTANSRAPYNIGGKLEGSENTSRGRSLLFFCSAVTIAGIIGEGTPIYVPENGFIGLNIPLTNSRKGTCSTRTTHPYFIKNFNTLISKVGIQHQIINFFAFKTKREIVKKVMESPVFYRGAQKTISCAHPCLPRYKKEGDKTYPKNCGYCYPCLIRKSSLLDISECNGIYSQSELTLGFLNNNIKSDTTNDFIALMSSVHRYLSLDENELKRLIKCTGHLEEEEVDKFLPVYQNTMEDLIELFSKDRELKKYIGIE